jgi:hypothetical protein
MKNRRETKRRLGALSLLFSLTPRKARPNDVGCSSGSSRTALEAAHPKFLVSFPSADRAILARRRCRPPARSNYGGKVSSNEAIALDANFKSWQGKRFPVPPKDLNVFEYYCVDQFLRQFDLSDSQLKTGLLGASKDGGVDALYMFINGELVDAETELQPKSPNRVSLLIMQMKEGEGFSPVAVDKLNFFADDLLELTRKKAEYHQAYRDELIKVMRLVKDKYLVSDSACCRNSWGPLCRAAKNI